MIELIVFHFYFLNMKLNNYRVINTLLFLLSKNEILKYGNNIINSFLF